MNSCTDYNANHNHNYDHNHNQNQVSDKSYLLFNIIHSLIYTYFSVPMDSVKIPIDPTATHLKDCERWDLVTSFQLSLFFWNKTFTHPL